MTTSIDSYSTGMVGATSTSSTASTSKSSVDSTKDQFLNLLIAQLKNQDPLSPADSSQFTAQMMQMGQLEQLFNLNETMQSAYELQQGGQIAQYSSLVGRNVLATGNQFQISGSNRGSINFSVSGTPTNTTVNVFDSYGNLVRQFDAEQVRNGDNSIAFDGLNNAGETLPNGYYSFFVDARDGEENAISSTTYSVGQISGLRIENGSPIFQMGNQDLGNSDIQRIF